MNITPSCAPPSSAEMAARLHRVQARMADHGLDLYLCADPDNVAYLTNFYNYVHERPFIVLVPARGKLIFLMPKLEEPHVRTRGVGEMEYVNYFEFPAPEGKRWSDRLKEIVGPQKYVGIEERCPHFIMQALPSRPTVASIVDDVRMVKSEYELERIAYTGKLLSDGFRQLLELAQPGQSILELGARVAGSMSRTLLCDNPRANLLSTSLYALVQPPLISHDPHNFTELSLPMTDGGPHVGIAVGRANGYGAEVERTFFLGHVPEAARKPFADMMAARALALELCRPGISMADVDRQVNELLGARGYSQNLLHRTGHSFGVTNHEAPFLAEGYDHPIEPNMVFSIEPGIYLPGIGGFRFSDTVLVNASGNQMLTYAPSTLEELTLPVH